LTQFQTFLRALAARNAQLLNLSDLARDLGIAVNTIKSWLSVLEATYQIFNLRPYHVNVGKRLVKRPKVYFMDTGVLCYLSGLRDPAHTAAGPMGGAFCDQSVPAFACRQMLSLRDVDLLIGEIRACILSSEDDVRLYPLPRDVQVDGLGTQ